MTGSSRARPAELDERFIVLHAYAATVSSASRKKAQASSRGERMSPFPPLRLLEIGPRGVEIGSRGVAGAGALPGAAGAGAPAGQRPRRGGVNKALPRATTKGT